MSASKRRAQRGRDEERRWEPVLKRPEPRWQFVSSGKLSAGALPRCTLQPPSEKAAVLRRIDRWMTETGRELLCLDLVDFVRPTVNPERPRPIRHAQEIYLDELWESALSDDFERFRICLPQIVSRDIRHRIRLARPGRGVIVEADTTIDFIRPAERGHLRIDDAIDEINRQLRLGLLDLLDREAHQLLARCRLMTGGGQLCLSRMNLTDTGPWRDPVVCNGHTLRRSPLRDVTGILGDIVRDVHRRGGVAFPIVPDGAPGARQCYAHLQDLFLPRDAWRLRTPGRADVPLLSLRRGALPGPLDVWRSLCMSGTLTRDEAEEARLRLPLTGHEEQIDAGLRWKDLRLISPSGVSHAPPRSPAPLLRMLLERASDARHSPDTLAAICEMYVSLNPEPETRKAVFRYAVSQDLCATPAMRLFWLTADLQRTRAWIMWLLLPNVMLEAEEEEMLRRSIAFFQGKTSSESLDSLPEACEELYPAAPKLLRKPPYLFSPELSRALAPALSASVETEQRLMREPKTWPTVEATPPSPRQG